MRFVIVIVATLALASPVAADEWTATDTAGEVTYAVFHVADWMQTRYIATHLDRYNERNVFLGTIPSIAEVDRWFAATLAGHALVAYLLPNPYRRVWQGAGIALEASMVIHNGGAGVGFHGFF